MKLAQSVTLICNHQQCWDKDQNYDSEQSAFAGSLEESAEQAPGNPAAEPGAFSGAFSGAFDDAQGAWRPAAAVFPGSTLQAKGVPSFFSAADSVAALGQQPRWLQQSVEPMRVRGQLKQAYFADVRKSFRYFEVLIRKLLQMYAPSRAPASRKPET